MRVIYNFVNYKNWWPNKKIMHETSYKGVEYLPQTQIFFAIDDENL